MNAEERKDIEFEVRGKRITIPNAVMTVIMVGITAALFYFLEDPVTAGWASAGFALLMMIAKGVDVNMDHVLTVLGRTREDLPEDLPEGIEPMGAPMGLPDSGGVPQEVHVRSASIIRAWLLE